MDVHIQGNYITSPQRVNFELKKKIFSNSTEIMRDFCLFESKAYTNFNLRCVFWWTWLQNEPETPLTNENENQHQSFSLELRKNLQRVY